MGLDINKTLPDGTSAGYWKVGHIESWTPAPSSEGFGCNLWVDGYATHAYREAGANSIMNQMYSCPYTGAKDLFEYMDLTGVSGEVTGAKRLGPDFPAGWDWRDNGVSGWMESSDDIRSGAYDWIKVCVPYFSGATDQWTVGEA